MASNIDPNKINKNFPVAGRDNDSSVFRNNFTGIYDNFAMSKKEISELQSYGIFKTSLPDQGQVDNDMGGTAIRNVTLSGVRESIKYHNTINGPAYVNFLESSVHLMDIAGPSSLVLQNWPSNTYATARVIVNLSTAQTISIASPVGGELYGFLTLPNATYNSITDIYSINLASGYHVFEISSFDGGRNYFVQDTTRNKTTVESALTVSGDILPQGNVVYNLGSPTQTFNNLYVQNTVSSGTSGTYSGNVTAANVVASTGIYGNVKTSSQPSITSLGTLTSLSVSGTLTGNNVVTTGNLTVGAALVERISYVSVNNGDAVVIPSNVSVVILTPNNTISSATLTMPGTPANGQKISIGFGNSITTLVHSKYPSQTALFGNLSSGNTTTFGTWVYHTASASWYRVG